MSGDNLIIIILLLLWQHACIHSNTHVHTHACTHTLKHTYMHTRTLTHTYMHAHTHAGTHVHTKKIGCLQSVCWVSTISVCHALLILDRLIEVPDLTHHQASQPGRHQHCQHDGEEVAIDQQTHLIGEPCTPRDETKH